ncbi:High-affinity zinc uptake system ATP-binding protein ZnuC [Sporomusa carbonis]|uniref:metal ABC transporter ATP-binding protein n=1 Tax=Sporomusa carbonis TaxID=3076075 RepID=UPI003A658DA1
MVDVKLNNITFGYNAEFVLNNISLTVENGEFVVVVGPNGAGKSTLLKIIAGLVEPAGGQVLIGGHRVRNAARQGIIGYVPQHYAQNTAAFPATVEEIVALGLVNSGLSLKSKGAKHIVSHMLELVGADMLKGRRIGELSGGQQQRVMVARALAGNPQLLLLDEPTSGIDYAASVKIYQLLSQLNTTLGITIVMVSHDIENATCSAAKVACINRSLCFFGSSEQFRSSHATMRHLWYYSGYTG